MITTAIVHGVGVPPPPVMSMSRCAHRARGGSARGGFDFGRTDTTSGTERSNGDQENEQRFPLRGHRLSARALSRYFLDEGTTSYTHTSPISTRPTATKVIPTTWRETANHSGGLTIGAKAVRSWQASHAPCTRGPNATATTR
jgi:hypothetical protein